MDRVAVFADAGYLFAQGSAALCGAKLTRGKVTLDHGAVAAVPALAEAANDLALLDDAARQVADGVSSTEIATRAASIRDTGQRPRDVDARLLATSRTRVGASLNAAQKAHVREAFQRALDARLPEPSG